MDPPCPGPKKIPNGDLRPLSISMDELDSIIDDQTSTPSQNMANELLTMNLNDSRSECTESITKSQNLKQSSISSYFHKK